MFWEIAAGFQLAFIKGRKRLGVRGEETDIRHWLPLRKSVEWLLFLSFFFLLLLGRTQKRRFDNFYQLNDMKSGLEFGSGPGSCFFFLVSVIISFWFWLFLSICGGDGHRLFFWSLKTGGGWIERWDGIARGWLNVCL